jgi:glutamate/tyrosine decarboxylase-like PLP-dependent enzyme
MMKSLLASAAERAQRYLSGLDSRSVRPARDAAEKLRELDQPLPNHSSSPEETLAILDTLGSPATMATAGRRFFGFVIGGSLPAALAANWLASAWDQNAGLSLISPIAAKLEEVSLRWLVDLFGLPPQTIAGFVTGATMANFTALAAARHAVLARAGWDVEAQGLFGAPPITVIISDESHPTVFKSLGMLGLGRERVVRIPVDDQGRMRAEVLPAISGPTIVCTQAGNVNTGSFDPVAAICAKAHAANAWVHVDGAFGLWAAAAPGRAHLVKGIDAADSWATDAHKWLNVPYDSGLAFVRDPDSLRAAMAIGASYLLREETRQPGDYTPECSRRARGVEIWAALYSLGRAGLAELIERSCDHASRFADRLGSAGYRILNDVVLNQVLVSFGTEQETRRIISDIQADGTCWCGGTVWQGQTAMRISICSWATTDEDVERSLDAILRIAARKRD